MRIVSRALRSLVVVVVYAGAWGWLHLLRHVALPGPRVADALPLYESARKDTLPLARVAGDFALAALAVALLFTPRRRLLATVMTAAGAVALTTIVSAQQLQLVRQSVIGLDASAALRTLDPWLAGAATLVVMPLAWAVLPRLRLRSLLTRPQLARSELR